MVLLLIPISIHRVILADLIQQLRQLGILKVTRTHIYRFSNKNAHINNHKAFKNFSKPFIGNSFLLTITDISTINMQPTYLAVSGPLTLYMSFSSCETLQDLKQTDLFVYFISQK